MKQVKNDWIRLVAIGIASCVALPAIAHAQQTRGDAAGAAPGGAPAPVAGAPAADTSGGGALSNIF